MNTKILLTLLAAFACALPTSCKSPAAAEVPCRCGTAMADFEGCAHPACIDGRSNPDNSACVCGMLEIPGKRSN